MKANRDVIDGHSGLNCDRLPGLAREIYSSDYFSLLRLEQRKILIQTFANVVIYFRAVIHGEAVVYLGREERLPDCPGPLTMEIRDRS